MGNLASTVQSTSKLQAENEALQKKVDALKQSKIGDTESIARLEKEVSKQKETVEVLKKAEEETKQSGTVCASTRKKLQSVTAEKNNLVEEVKRLNEQHKAKLQKRKDEKEADVLKCTNDEEALRQSQQKMEELAKTHAKEVKTLENKLKLKKPNEKLVKQIKDLERDHESKIKAIEEKRALDFKKWQTKRSDWENTRKSLKQDNITKKKQFTEAEQKITDLKKTAQKTEQLAKRLKEERDKLKDVLLELKYKNFQVNNTNVSIDVVPESKYSLKINHIDVQSAGFAQITYIYSDKTTDVFKFRGNGGLEFENSQGIWQRFDQVKDHGLALKEHLRLKRTYQVICSSVAGKNTWEFKSPTKVSKIVLKEQSNWGGLRDATLSKVG